jgi:RNA polymerase sigma factor (sigma-70 family)
MTFSDTKALASALAQLDDHALKYFGSVYGPRLRHYFLRHGLNVTDAESLAVSMITDIALKIPDHYVERSGKFDAWVFTLARNGLSDWRRDQPPQPEWGLEAAVEIVPVDPALVEAVEAAVAKLGATDQEIIRRRDLGHKQSFDEIGKDLGLDPRTARVRRSRALRKLEAILTADPRIQSRLPRWVKAESEGKHT